MAAIECVKELNSKPGNSLEKSTTLINLYNALDGEITNAKNKMKAQQEAAVKASNEARDKIVKEAADQKEKAASEKAEKEAKKIADAKGKEKNVTLIKEKT